MTVRAKGRAPPPGPAGGQARGRGAGAVVDLVHLAAVELARKENISEAEARMELWGRNGAVFRHLYESLPAEPEPVAATPPATVAEFTQQAIHKRAAFFADTQVPGRTGAEWRDVLWRSSPQIEAWGRDGTALNSAGEFAKGLAHGDPEKQHLWDQVCAWHRGSP